MRFLKSVVIVLFLSVFPVFGAIVLDPLVGATYNLGDTVLVSGDVTSDVDFKGYLALYLSCQSSTNGTSSQQLFLKLYDFKKGVSRSFSDLVSLSSSGPGTCTIEARFMDLNTNVKEKVNSNTFTLTPTLDGLFDIVKKELQLGEKLVLHGSVTKLNGQPVEGVAHLSFHTSNQSVLTETVDVLNGVVDFQKDMSSMPPGVYAIDVRVTDVYGNAFDYTSQLSLQLVNELFVTLNTDKSLYAPSDTVSLLGTARGKVSQALSSPEVTLTVDGQEFVQTLGPGADDFTFSYTVPATSKSGMHAARVVVRDLHGNEGVKDTSFDVKAIPTKYALTLTKEFFNPREVIEFTPQLYDQASDVMDGTVVVSLHGPDGELQYQKTLKTGTSQQFTFPQFAVPGAWSLRLEGYGLSLDSDLVVNEFYSLNFGLEGQSLYVTNDGNVVYTKDLVISAKDQEVRQPLNLAINETLVFDLYDLFKDGTYTISLPEHDASFENVAVQDTRSFLRKFSDGFSGVTGSVVRGTGGVTHSGWLWLVVGVFVVVGALVFVKAKRPTGTLDDTQPSTYKYSDVDRQKDYEEGLKKRQEVSKEPPVRKPRYSFGKASDDDIVEFRKRMSQVVQEQEKSDKKYFSGNEGPGFRNMFS